MHLPDPLMYSSHVSYKRDPLIRFCMIIFIKFEQITNISLTMCCDQIGSRLSLNHTKSLGDTNIAHKCYVSTRLARDDP